MTPEAKARLLIDQKLEQAGWVIQDKKQVNLGAGLGVDVREYATDTGPADYVLFIDRKPVGVIYDLRTNKHFTLKTRPLKFEDLQEFIDCYHPDNRHERTETERFKYFSYDELIARDKASLDIFWLKDDSLDNLDDLPPPDVLQQEIIEHLEAALAAFRDVAASLPKSST